MTSYRGIETIDCVSMQLIVEPGLGMYYHFRGQLVRYIIYVSVFFPNLGDYLNSHINYETQTFGIAVYAAGWSGGKPH